MKKIIVIAFLIIPASLFLFGMKKNFVRSKDGTSIMPVQKSMAAGQNVFKKYCATCHQADGGGVPNMNPPLIKTPYVLGDKERLIKIVLHGFNENVEIEGEYYKNPMPELSILKDQEIADVLTYVRNSFGNKASAITAAEVKAVRQKGK